MTEVRVRADEASIGRRVEIFCAEKIFVDIVFASDPGLIGAPSKPAFSRIAQSDSLSDRRRDAAYKLRTPLGTNATLRRSDAELALQDVVDGLRVGLATRRLHYLADEPPDFLWFC